MIEEASTDTVADSSMAIPPSVRNKVIDHVYQFSGITLGALTCNFVDTRLRRRLRALQIQEPADYVDYLAVSSDEVGHLVNVFTTNETSFFRTRSLWQYVEETLLPEFAGGSTPRAPMFWSAACSTGEEPYTLAMLCQAQFESCAVKPRIHATDINTDVLNKAADGLYSGRSIRRLQISRGEMINRYFERRGDDYQVDPAIRKLVKFDRHNLMRAPESLETYDFVLLRNVLIYFARADQIRILRNITSSMRPGGVLAIGESESLAFCESELEFVKPFLYRKPKSE